MASPIFPSVPLGGAATPLLHLLRTTGTLGRKGPVYAGHDAAKVNRVRTYLQAPEWMHGMDNSTTAAMSVLANLSATTLQLVVRLQVICKLE